MKRIMILPLLWIPGWLVAQSISPRVISTCGNVFTGSSAILEWSAGETAISSYSASTFLLTEGFHQPNLLVTAVTEGQSMDMEVWPNPVMEVLHLRAQGIGDGTLRIDLYNALGQLVFHQDWHDTGSVLEVSMAAFSTGAYTLVVGGSATRTRSWKIVKLAY